MVILHRSPAWVPAVLPSAGRNRSVSATQDQPRPCVPEASRRRIRRKILCYGLKDEKNLTEQLKLAILREDYILAANIRDDLARERGVDVHQLKRQLESAIASENYSEAARLRDQLKATGEGPSSSDGSKEVTYTSTMDTSSIRVTATSAFVPQRSSPEKSSFFFVYEIKIENLGSNTVQLRSRCWNITDANGKLNTVRGPGVIGKYPILGPGSSFSYISACPLPTATGVMEGSYDFLLLDSDDKELKSVPLNVAVAPFLLSTSVVGNINIDDK